MEPAPRGEGAQGVTAAWAVRVARTLVVPLERVITLEAHPAGAFRLEPGGPGHRLVLKRVRSPGGGERRCVFALELPGGQVRCGLGADCGCARGPRRDDDDEALVAAWHAALEGREAPATEELFFHYLLNALPSPRDDGAVPCGSCPTSRCCVVFDPELTGPDLARLSRALSLPPGAFAALCPVHGGQAGPDGIRLGGAETWELRLRRAGPALSPAEPARCAFLVALGPEHARCGAYASRPMTCRTFPTDETRFGVMVHNPPAVCPPGAWAQERADLPGLGLIHRAAAAERARWREFLSAWNGVQRQAALAGLPKVEAEERLFAAILQDA